MSSRYAVVLVKGPGTQYLVGKRKDNGKINFPAGGVNEGEDPKDGAARELLEETGFKAKNLNLCGIYNKEKQGKPILVYVYTSEYEGTPNLENDPDLEFQSIFWANPFSFSSSELHVPPGENSGLKALIKIMKGDKS